MTNLKIAICPGCAQSLATDNTGCPHCGYEDNISGRVLTLEEITQLNGDDQVHTFNDVSPAFIAAVVQAAKGGPSTVTSVMVDVTSLLPFIDSARKATAALARSDAKFQALSQEDKAKRIQAYINREEEHQGLLNNAASLAMNELLRLVPIWPQSKSKE